MIELIRIKDGIYRPKVIHKNNDGKEVYMFVRIGQIRNGKLELLSKFKDDKELRKLKNVNLDVS